MDLGGDVYVVTVHAPTWAVFQAVLRALGTVTPAAYMPSPPPTKLVEALLERAEVDGSNFGLTAGQAIEPGESYGGTGE
jgi:hypothetical protein